MVKTNVAACAILWTAKNVCDLAQGLQVSESLQLSPTSRALFYTNNSPLASTDSFEKPSEDNLIRVMAKLVSTCKERQAAFAETMFKKLTVSATACRPDVKHLVAERVRADLDNRNATFVDASTVPDLRTFFESKHFQAYVHHVYVWMDIDNEQFMLAHQPQLVLALRDIIVAAVKWGHVHFVVLPVPYAASLLPVFESFMQEFNETTIDLPNVTYLLVLLWFNYDERLDGARVARSLGSNARIADFTTLSKLGRVSRRSARAALRFIRQLKPSFVPEHVDLYDPSSQQPSTSSSTPQLHGVRHGMIQKHTCRGHSHPGNNSSRGAPNKPGGDGSRGHDHDKRQAQGNRRN